MVLTTLTGISFSDSHSTTNPKIKTTPEWETEFYQFLPIRVISTTGLLTPTLI